MPTPKGRRNYLGLAASAVSMAWCALMGLRIWWTPITGSGVGSDGVQFVTIEPFSETSYFAAAFLLVPVLIAAVGTCAASQRAPVVVGFAAVLLAAFSFITGFSIGSAYQMPAGVLMLAAFLTAIRAAQPAAR